MPPTHGKMPAEQAEPITTADLIEQLAGEFRAGEERMLRRNAGPQPQHSPRASGIDHCSRAMALDILKCEARPAFSDWQLARMQRGREIEELIVTPGLQRLGFKVIESQASLVIRDESGTVICTGHPDGLIDYAGERIVFDCKSVAPHLWHKLNSLEDFWHDPWCYRQPIQLLLYMHAMELSIGVLILDDCLGHRKLVFVRMAGNEERVAAALRKCSLVVEAVKNHELPDYCGDPAVCRRCRWCGHGCEPPLDYSESGGIKIISDEELEHALRVRESNREPAKNAAWAERIIGKAIKPLADGDYLCGPFRLALKRSQRKGYVVQDGEVLLKKIERIADDVSQTPPVSAAS